MNTREENNKELASKIEKEEKEKKRKKIFKIVFWVLGSLLVIFSIIYILLTYVGNMGLVVREYQIKDSLIPDYFDGVKIIQFSDVHYGNYLGKDKIKQLVNAINRANPDLVLFTGDLVEKDYKISDEEKLFLIEQFKNIETTLGKFAITGEIDGNITKEIFTSSDFEILVDQTKKIYKGNSSSYIELISFSPECEKIDTEKDKFSIVMTHEPDNVTKILELIEPNIVLAGHSHNGQVRLPFIGALINKENAKKYHDSYYKIANTKLFISGGIGNSKFNIRLFNHPSINFYRLKQS